MKIDRAIRDVQEAEVGLAEELRRVGERHALHSELYHQAHTLAARCDEQLERLRPSAERYGSPDAAHTGESPPVVERLRRLSAELLGRHEASGLLLLHDLRILYLAAHEAEISWTVLIQAAKAIRDPELLHVAAECREHAETRWKWLRTRLKESSPQVLVAG